VKRRFRRAVAAISSLLPIRLASRVLPPRFINCLPLHLRPPSPRGRSPATVCDRNYHFIRRFASVQANLSPALRPFFFSLESTDFPRARALPSPPPLSPCPGRQGSLRKRPTSRGPRRETRITRAARADAIVRYRPLSPSPSPSLFLSLSVMETECPRLGESTARALSQFQRTIDPGHVIVTEKWSAFEIPDNANAEICDSAMRAHKLAELKYCKLAASL